MSQQDFIIWVFCWVDENLAELQQGTRFRSRGFPPKLSDAEAITMEVVGEFLGFSTDKGIWTYFNSHWREWFPRLGSRANFAKQISNLWFVKQPLQEELAILLGAFDRPVHIIDGFPLPVCLFKRAKGCARFKGQADYGFCAAKSETYYGFKGQLRNRYGDLPDSSLYALTAAHEAVLDAGLESGDEVLREAAVFAGNNEAQADILDERVEGNDSRWIQYGYSGYQVAADVRKSLRAKGPIMTVHNTCASANVAMETALQALQSGVINTAVVGAADAFSLKVWSGFYMLNALGEQRCLPFSSHRRFITISEGAAFLILQREDSLLPHQIPIAELVAVFSNNDAKHPTNPDSESVHVCHKQLLITAGISADDVDVIYAHGTGTRANDVVEAAIFAQDYPRAQVTAIKGTVGHMMGTAGAIGAVASCLTLKTQQVPPTQTITPEFDFNLVTEVSPRSNGSGMYRIIRLALAGIMPFHSFGYPEGLM